MSSLLAIQKAFLVLLSKPCVYQAENVQLNLSPFSVSACRAYDSSFRREKIQNAMLPLHLQQDWSPEGLKG
jgi:hypothetical protein